MRHPALLLFVHVVLERVERLLHCCADAPGLAGRKVTLRVYGCVSAEKFFLLLLLLPDLQNNYKRSRSGTRAHYIQCTAQHTRAYISICAHTHTNIHTHTHTYTHTQPRTHTHTHTRTRTQTMLANAHCCRPTHRWSAKRRLRIFASRRASCLRRGRPRPATTWTRPSSSLRA